MTQTAANPTTLLTADEFLAHPAARERSELVRGEIRMMTPASAPHGIVSGNVYGLLWTFVRANRLGRCFTDGTGFALPGLPNTVRSPDAAFVRGDRLPAGGLPSRSGFLPLAPDLAVEVLSPSETASDLEEKLDDYRVAGTPLVWIVDPAKRRVSVIAADAPIHWLREGDTLDGGTVLPGFSCPVADLFDGLAPLGAEPPATA
jgi:Uma2 family endonuclease